ncbi:MAG: class I SAM-dependent methyltransferase [Sulfuricella sp.]|nr:class I SAM-dependent methyltransferase [Sulfuricella sp.]
MLQAQVMRLVERRLREACLPVNFEFWNGKALRLSDSPAVTVNVRSPKGLSSLMRPTLGKFARNYVEQHIDLIGGAKEIIRLGEILCQASSRVARKSLFPLSWRRHNRAADRRAISYHYDVSNAFYGLWLDRRWVYSCAYFHRPDDSLDLAQEQKLDHICRKLDLKENQLFLDIGCGWGGLMLWAAERYGVMADGITLSRGQYQYVSDQIRERGLESRCRVRLMDYRDLPETEQFDKIASVGMFEHVGRKNFPAYFGKIYRLLKPGGLVLNHGITSVRTDGAELGSGLGEFIDRYVFPGGELAHVSAVTEAMCRQNLECWDVECLRPHYAKTLWHWVDRLEARHDEASRLVGEDRFRIWRIYMAGSAHAFERGWLSLFQVLAAKPLGNGAAAYPLTREHIYAQ